MPRPAASKASSAATVARPATVATDGWSGYAGLAAAGYAHEPLNLSASWGDAALRLPAIHLVFGLAKRWLLGTHHGAVSAKHLPAYLDEFVFRFNRRTAKSISHRFARVIEHAVLTPPTTYRALVAKRSLTRHGELVWRIVPADEHALKFVYECLGTKSSQNIPT